MSRCINNAASTFLQIVEVGTCQACPVKVACSQRAEAKSSGTLPLPNLDGYPVCEHRRGSSQEPICGVTGLPVSMEVCDRCDSESRDHVANVGSKMYGYLSAVKRWVAAGRPARPPEEVERLFRDHCSVCELYDKENHACKNCGCSVSADGAPLANKISMATEKCPLGRW